MEIQVRDARITDIDRIAALIDEARPEADSVVLGAHDSSDLLRQLVYLPNATVLVALDGRSVVGAAMLALRPSVVHGGLVGAIDFLVVDQAHEANEVAGRLLREAIRSARNKGCRVVEAEGSEHARLNDRFRTMGFVDDVPRLVQTFERIGIVAG